ncbi:MAG: hydrogenase maturation nickel metallochaperone HypA [Phycisphaeraceae bacterium]
MHELSIALSIVDLVSDEAQRRGGPRVEAVHLKVGPLSGVVTEALRSAYQLACEGTPLHNTRLVIEQTPLVTHCDTCQVDQPVRSIQQMRCAACGAPAGRLVSGEELEVIALEIHP